jgi:starch synthase (maltosyl-transferring)
MVASVSFLYSEAGPHLHVNGITVNKSAQIVEGAAGGAFFFEDIYPSIDSGRFPVKRLAGERVEVWADILCGGDVTAAKLIWRREGEGEWRSTPMSHHSNDRWFGAFVPDRAGHYAYAIEAWTDQFATWRRAFIRKLETGADVTVDAIEGAGMLTKAQAGGWDATSIILRQCEAFLQSGDAAALLSDELKDAMAESQFRPDLTRSQLFPLVVDRTRARFGAWYELVPRNQDTAAAQYVTFKDCIACLADIEAMGFDVICLPPIDPAVQPELGALHDFRDFTVACSARGLEVALTFAAQYSPDHPWVTRHPQWFKRRPDGSLRPAESPGETREIVALDFTCADAGALWNALRDEVLFWVEQGVRIFRVDNPETLPLPFLEWLIQEVQRRYPEVIFLAEAAARPKLMKGLAKLGFTQSHISFTDPNGKWELEQYLAELAAYPVNEFFRPNVFVGANMQPDDSVRGEAWMVKSRLALAAMLSANYCIYNGFELLESRSTFGSDEYLDSDKFALKVRDWNRPNNIQSYISVLNSMRQNNAALQQTSNLRFIAIDDGNVIAFVKQSADRTNTVAVAIALSRDVHEFWLPLGDTKIVTCGEHRHVATVENLLTGELSALDWGGIKLRIEPERDPALFFRCLA